MKVLTLLKLTAQKMKFSIKDFLSKCDQIRSFPRIWSHLLKKFLIENFIFCAVIAVGEGEKSSFCTTDKFQFENFQTFCLTNLPFSLQFSSY